MSHSSTDQISRLCRALSTLRMDPTAPFTPSDSSAYSICGKCASAHVDLFLQLTSSDNRAMACIFHMWKMGAITPSNFLAWIGITMYVLYESTSSLILTSTKTSKCVCKSRQTVYKLSPCDKHNFVYLFKFNYLSNICRFEFKTTTTHQLSDHFIPCKLQLH